MTADARTAEVLYESEAALRLVDQGIYDLRGSAPTDPRLQAIAGNQLPANLELANQQILNILAHVRDTRSTLQHAASGKLQFTHEKIREVTSATEDAAINILDACDRANVLVNTLDTIDASETPDREHAKTVRLHLRDELFQMMGALQFQDITAQQLSSSSALLIEVEARLKEVAHLLDTNGSVDRGMPTPAAVIASCRDETYDPNATTKQADVRQALADEIFTAIKAPAA